MVAQDRIGSQGALQPRVSKFLVQHVVNIDTPDPEEFTHGTGSEAKTELPAQFGQGKFVPAIHVL